MLRQEWYQPVIQLSLLADVVHLTQKHDLVLLKFIQHIVQRCFALVQKIVLQFFVHDDSSP